MDTIKWIDAKLPQALTAIFETEEAGVTLKMKDELRQDKDHPYFFEGYLAGGYGDSGNPYWIDVFDKDNGYRKTAVAVYAEGCGVAFERLDLLQSINPNIKRICRELATKLNRWILEWIKDKAGIPK